MKNEIIIKLKIYSGVLQVKMLIIVKQQRKYNVDIMMKYLHLNLVLKQQSGYYKMIHVINQQKYILDNHVEVKRKKLTDLNFSTAKPTASHMVLNTKNDYFSSTRPSVGSTLNTKCSNSSVVF